jgi:hypothetical protein
MKIFGRKPDSDASRRSHAAKQKQGPPSSSHRVTLDLHRAEVLAAMLAKSRSSNTLEVADLLAGMYISNWERLSQYWEESKQEEIELLLRGICRISPQRWHSWIESYDKERRDNDKRVWQRLRMSKNGKASAKSLQLSAELTSVLKRAEETTPFREKAGNPSIPILTAECVLLCILQTPGSEISRRLAESGIDAAKLQRDVLLPRRAPRS